MDVEVQGGATEYFFMDVNQYLADEISDGMMSEIDNIQEYGDLPKKIRHIVHEAARELMLTHTPVRKKHEDQSLNVLIEASTLGSPHIREL